MYDQSSGQVFREWTQSRKTLSDSQPDHGWSRRCPYHHFIPRGSRGPRSLVDIATNVVANSIGQVTEKHLEALPPRLRWRVWRFLEARGVCLHAWKLFSKVLLKDEDDKTLGLYRYRQHICKPTHGLPWYTQPLISPTTEFVTHLVISGGCEFTPSEMLCLADMGNLGVLEIIQPADELRAAFPDMTDRLVRGWSDKGDPFPSLRALRIWGDQSTTQDSLQWVSRFPALALYDVMGSREDWAQPHDRAVEQGWQLADPAKGMEDSLLRYLLLLAPGDGILRTATSSSSSSSSKRPKDMARSIDSDLVSLCGDSRCAVKFVEHGQAPALLDYLNDTAKMQTPPWDTANAAHVARSCRGVPFEAWAFWLYALVGQLNDDRDMKTLHRGRPTSQAVVGPFVLPSKPFACLFLGHSGRGGISSKPSYVSRGLFATKRFTFTRPNAFGRGGQGAQPQRQPRPDPEIQETPNPGQRFRRYKRKRLDDVLSSFIG